MTNAKAGRYVEISEAQVPGGVRLSTPQGERGQTVEWAYGSVGQRGEGARGDAFASKTDKSIGGVTTYYRWVR